MPGLCFLDGEPVPGDGELAGPALIGHTPAVEEDFAHRPIVPSEEITG